MNHMEPTCENCFKKSCHNLDGQFPTTCVSTHMNEAVLAEAMAEYEKEEIRKVTRAAAEVETENYCKMSRLEETVELAKKLGAKKIGIATCIGLLKESSIAAKVFRSHGFEVYIFGCKAGMQKKADVGIPEFCNETGINMCNPILQAKLCNAAHTDLNVLVGLCVGHDSMFYKYSEALVTTLVVKDRVMGHNPVAALYQADNYMTRVYGDKKE